MDNIGSEFVLDANYNISEMKAVEFAYMLAKRILEQIPSPIFLSNDRQLKSKAFVRENDAADFDSLGNVQYETMKPSHETMKPSQLWKSGTIKTGDLSSGKKELIMKLRKLSVIEMFDFSIQKSWKHLFYAKCFVPGCSWKICAAAMSRSSPEFLVRKHTDLHTCYAADRYSRHRQANAKCIDRMYVE
ncbi:hypothetical protein F2Q70_00013211 [Brassica cretica]|uniref:Transposase MuDR plant domain-containing protein n=1 Tax=Brassica cretica TaxID=69181 RepID=A0A8S9LZ05_BRACR|nr:hypothetical protein F2Q70_00013211 [Brassica cretica]